MQTCVRRRMLVVLEGDRRHGDRRGDAVRMRLRERRSGFDRRAAEPAHPILRFLDRGVRVLRGEPWRLGVLLLFVVALGWLDLAFTLEALAAGAREVNPLMAHLFELDVRVAAAFKLGTTVAVVAGLWHLRGYRRIIETTLVILGGMLALVAYHIVLQSMMA